MADFLTGLLSGSSQLPTSGGAIPLGGLGGGGGQNQTSTQVTNVSSSSGVNFNPNIIIGSTLGGGIEQSTPSAVPGFPLMPGLVNPVQFPGAYPITGTPYPGPAPTGQNLIGADIGPTLLIAGVILAGAMLFKKMGNDRGTIFTRERTYYTPRRRKLSPTRIRRIRTLKYA